MMRLIWGDAHTHTHTRVYYANMTFTGLSRASRKFLRSRSATDRSIWMRDGVVCGGYKARVLGTLTRYPVTLPMVTR